MATESKTPLVLSVLFVAVILGLLSDILLRGVQWGANLPIWISILISGLFLAKHLGGGKLEFGSVLLIIPMAIFSVCFAWRDSTALKNLDLAAVLLSAALIITRQSQPFWSPTISKMFRSVFNLGGHCVAGFIHLLARDMDWTQRRNAAVAANVRGVASGVVIAIPLLLVFGFLFMRADAIVWLR
jgi:hypothetical protein